MLLKKNKLEEDVDTIISLDQYSDIFEKIPPRQKLSFNELKQKVIDNDAGTSGQIAMVFLLLVIGFGFSALYLSFVKNLGLLDGNIVLSLLLFFFGVLSVFYTSTFFLVKFFNAKNIFNYQRADIINKQFYEYFLSSDTDNFASELKSNFSTQLEKIGIQQCNPDVYDYINHSINSIDGNFRKLKNRIEYNLQREIYSFEPFYEFFKEISTIKGKIDNANDIKVINQ